MGPCPRCGVPLTTPLACAACRALLEPANEPTPFEIFGLAPSAAVDAGALQKRLLQLALLVHPDHFGSAAPEQRALAERNSARLNAAFQILSDNLRRADYLVRRLGGGGDERSMPAEFLDEVLEWNESIEDARATTSGSPERAALAALGARLDAERALHLGQALRRLTPLPEPGAPRLAEVQRLLNAIRYLDRARREIAELALGAPPQTARTR